MYIKTVTELDDRPFLKEERDSNFHQIFFVYVYLIELSFRKGLVMKWSPQRWILSYNDKQF